MNRCRALSLISTVFLLVAGVICTSAQAAQIGFAQIAKAQRLLCGATTERARHDLIYNRDFSTAIGGNLPHVPGFWRSIDIAADAYRRNYAAERKKAPEIAREGLDSVIDEKFCTPSKIQHDLDHTIEVISRGGRQFRPENQAVCFVSFDDYKALTKRRKAISSAAVAENAVGKCRAFYRGGYFAPEFSRLQVRSEELETVARLAKQEQEMADRAAALRAEQLEAQRQREETAREGELRARHAAEQEAEQERIRQEAALLKAIDSLAPASSARVVYGPNSSAVQATDTLYRTLNEANQSAWSSYDEQLIEVRRKLDNSPVFEKPVLERGEYEKSTDFEKRQTAAVNEARAEHERGLAAWNDERSAAQRNYQRLVDGETIIVTQLLNEELDQRLGKTRIGPVEYNADSEVFNITVRSSAFDEYRIEGRIAIPIDRAPKVKPDLVSGTSWVVFRFEDYRLHPVGVVIKGANSNNFYQASVMDSTFSDFSFNRTSLARFQVEQTLEKQARLEQAEREKTEMEQRRAAERERKRQERASWPEGVTATLSSGAFICATHKSAFKAQVVERANNPYISLPDDCRIVPGQQFVVNYNHVGGGLAVVRLRGGFTNVYVSAAYLVN